MTKRFAAPLVLGLALLAGTAQAEGFNAGIELRDKVSLADIGLPAYPGAVLVKDLDKNGKEDKGSFGFSLWGGSFGIQFGGQDECRPRDFAHRSIVASLLMWRHRMRSDNRSSRPVEL